MERNWAEKTGLWLNGIAPVLLGLGMVGLFIEFKTPGFGIFGTLGLILLLGVFRLRKSFAGLAGQEELLVFSLGLCLVAVEVFLLPGFLLPGIVGVLLIVGSVFWAMVDVGRIRYRLVAGIVSRTGRGIHAGNRIGLRVVLRRLGICRRLRFGTGWS